MAALPGGAARRAGFTLIELLIVVAILAALAALVAGGIKAVRSTQQVKVTEDHLSKLQTALSQQWTAVLDQVRDDAKNQKIPPAVVSFCGNDTDRAAALWAYIKVRQEFPQTFQEARTPVILAGQPVLQPRQTFASVPNVATGDPAGESATLFYLMLSEKGNRGMVFSADDAGGQGEIELPVGSGNKFRVFKDAWGGPIAFVRFCGLAEVNQPPFAKQYKHRTDMPGTFDALDRLERLVQTDPLVWTPAKKLDAEKAVGLNTLSAMPAPFTSAFNTFNVGANRMPVLASAGPDKAFGGNEDVYSHRLKRTGDRGD